ncbi:peptidase, partial [Weissella confusa]
MKTINVKGAVMDNDSAWFYDYFGMDYTSPKSVA